MRFTENDTASYVIAEASEDIEMRSRPERWPVSSSADSIVLCTSASLWKRYLAVDLAAAFKHIALDACCSFGRHDGDCGLLFEIQQCVLSRDKKAISSQKPVPHGFSEFGWIYAGLQIPRTCLYSQPRPMFVAIRP